MLFLYKIQFNSNWGKFELGNWGNFHFYSIMFTVIMSIKDFLTWISKNEQTKKYIMAATRRTSTSFVPKATPYQIYHTVQDSGKNVAGSKKKLCWRFGWTDSEMEHSVDLKHSLVTGKRVFFICIENICV